MEENNSELGMSPSNIPEKIVSIVGTKDIDSSGSREWKKFLEKSSLNEAWSAPDGSPYRQFEKKKTINAIDNAENLQPRYSEGERQSEAGIGNLLRSGVLDKRTAVVLDSGGPHSVAMAVKLAKELGYQPILMFDDEPRQNGTNNIGENLACLLYFADEIKRLKNLNKIVAAAPPAFILDTHRDEKHTELDLPDAKMLIQYGINKIVYLNEGDQNGKIDVSFQSILRVNDDLKHTVSSWEEGGITMLYTGVKPWRDFRSTKSTTFFKKNLR